MSDSTNPTFIVETPEQFRALSDPLRQRLLERFLVPATIKQTAERLGEPVTKLYRHVDQLLAAGLIKVVAEEKKRAVVERTFQTAARRFAVSPGAFAGAGGAASREQVARAAIEEVLASAATDDGAFRMLRSRVRLSEADRERLEAEIGTLLETFSDPAAPEVEILMWNVRRD